MTDVLVIGGGIAGTAAALALARVGIEATVYEAHPDSGEDIGAFLTLASNGMAALAEIGAAEATARVGFPLTTLRLIDGAGTEIARRPLDDLGRDLTRYRCLRRAELCAVLQAEAARRGIRIEHGRRLAAVTTGPDHVAVRFHDGTAATGRLLVGADGLRSTVRSITDPDVSPRYAGQRIFYGYTSSDPPPPDRRATIDMISGRAVAFGVAVSPAGDTYWFARVTADALPPDEIAHTPPSDWRHLLVDLLRSDDTPAAAIVAGTGDELMVTNAHDLAPGTRWRAERTVIIGDAAHAASPATGQGASMALEDAVMLAEALHAAPTGEEALQHYEQLRRPRVEENIVASARLSAGRPAP
jgi:2-polyprenyl-6-methoxyphenol hydroxylase-like FAD-dependent oxidoreductase